MVMDVQHRTVAFRLSEIEHRYGPAVHILADPLALTLLARVGEKDVVQPEVGRLVADLYRMLVHAVLAAEFPRTPVEVPTRMIDTTPEGVWRGEALRPDTESVVVALARAGLLPAQVTYDMLNEVLRPAVVRQDHLALGRETDTSGKVTGAALGAAKIGGPIDGRMVLIPDPLGATGSTVSTVLGAYGRAARMAPGGGAGAASGGGTARRVIALHLIVTPEYLRRITADYPEVIVYAFRVDRGLSSADVLGTVPGTRWAEERGLSDHQYIVPGAGGLGEVLNNSFV
jgi:uracil phosphoribosyltransferase